MKIISHRANLNGSNPTLENTLLAITDAIKNGFDVEIDIWLINNKLAIGHDQINTSIDNNLLSFLLNYSDRLWIHCKNIECLNYLLNYSKLNIFSHSNDPYVLTSHNYIFCKPGIKPIEHGIIVMPELMPIYTKSDFQICNGILTDYPYDVLTNNYTRFIR